MEQKDAQLIQQVLQGDQEAFAILVNKYQKGVHALAWRKIGDFSHRSGNHAGRVSQGISETRNIKKS